MLTHLINWSIWKVETDYTWQHTNKSTFKFVPIVSKRICFWGKWISLYFFQRWLDVLLVASWMHIFQRCGAPWVFHDFYILSRKEKHMSLKKIPRKENIWKNWRYLTASELVGHFNHPWVMAIMHRLRCSQNKSEVMSYICLHCSCLFCGSLCVLRTKT